MSGDYRRHPFDPRRNYSSVLLQQGRILLDQDWNEQSAIVSHGFRAAVVENQLYRVEVHAGGGGKAGIATFKWSHDNASSGARVTRWIDPLHIGFQDAGDFPVSQRFSGGDLIEITDDARELAGLPGEMRRIKTIDAASSAFTLDAPLSPGLFPCRPKWCSRSDASYARAALARRRGDSRPWQSNPY
jgi:hypothetical protein